MEAVNDLVGVRGERRGGNRGVCGREAGLWGPTEPRGRHLFDMVKRSRRLLALLRQNLSPRARSIRPHHYLHFELVPGYRSPDGAATHNSYGFRGKEFTIKKPVGAKRVVG